MTLTVQPERGQVAILANRRAGPRGGWPAVEALVSALHGLGLESRICETPAELEDFVRTDAGRLRCIVAAGGDGTLLEVLNRAPGLPVAILPTGNENLVARYFGIECSGPKVAGIIAAAETRQLDLIRVDGRRAALMVSAGFDAEVVHRVHRRRAGHVSRLTYGWHVLAAGWEYGFPPVRVAIEETGEVLTATLVLAFNLPRYGLGLPIAPRARPDDGLLDLYAFQAVGFGGLLRSVRAVLAGRHHGRRDVQYRRVRRVRWTARAAVPLQTDGDPAGCLPAEIEVMPAAFRLLVPATAAQGGGTGPDMVP